MRMAELAGSSCLRQVAFFRAATTRCAMLRILGSPQRLCGGLTRRDLLRAGGLGLAGLGLADVLRLQDAAASEDAPHDASFGRAKNVILVHLYGSPSQIETFDPKPNAPL